MFRRHGAAYRQTHAGHLSQGQRRVMAIEACRTAALGGHVGQCADCGQVRIAYNSCHQSALPEVPGAQLRAAWLADRQAELLPVPYFHVVFTVPAPIAEIAFQNKTVVYGILFQAAAETLRLIAADPRHLGAASGWWPCSTPGARTPAASASSLRRPRWWALCRWNSLDRLPARLFLP